MKNRLDKEKNAAISGAVNSAIFAATLGVSVAIFARVFGRHSKLPLPKRIIRTGATFGLAGGVIGSVAGYASEKSLNFFVNRAARTQQKMFAEQYGKQHHQDQGMVADEHRVRVKD